MYYQYDDANQLTNEVQAISGQPSAFSVGYTYDEDGRRRTMTYPDGTIVTNHYTAKGQLAFIQNGHPNPIVQYTYDALGNRTSKTLDNHTVTTYAYDVANQLTTIRHQQSAAEFARFDYAYNSVGNRASKTQTGGLAESYAYDAIDQLTGVLYTTNAVNERTVSYEYDPVGNRQTVTENGLPTHYTVNLLNQYDGFRYDANGNLTTHAGWTLTYDAQNRMVEASSPSSVIRFQYDARNRCVSRTINGITTYFAYDGWNLIEDHDATGNVLARYYHGAGVDELLARATPSGTVYYHQDALGSTTHLTDSTGAVVESYRYDAFGAPLSASAIGNRFLFTGREWLSDLNLYDYRNRLYSPSLGRFLQVDPIGFNAGDINVYRYAWNGVVVYLDSYGLWKSEGHTDLTRDAANGKGLSTAQIRRAINANVNEDRVSNQGNNAAHYMPGSREQSQQHVNDTLTRAIQNEASGNHTAAMDALGEGLHAVQDRLAHDAQDAGWPAHRPFGSAPDNPTRHPNEYNQALEDSRAYIDQFKQGLEEELQRRKQGCR